jgi:hypothetical protein
VETSENHLQVGSHVVVVTTMPLSAEVRGSLSEMLGDGYLLLDIKDAPSTTNIVLTTVLSRRSLDSLRKLFPAARILLTELDDPEQHISYPGPISRALDAGPDGYYVAHGLEALPAIVKSEAQLQLLGSTRPTPMTIDTGERHWRQPVSTALRSPVSAPHGAIIWLREGVDDPDLPAGKRLELRYIDEAVGGLLATDDPRTAGLWAALAAESAAYLARKTGENVLVDVSDLDPAIAAQLQVHVSSERLDQSSWPPADAP